jgi:hypothetical protein
MGLGYISLLHVPLGCFCCIFLFKSFRSNIGWKTKVVGFQFSLFFSFVITIGFHIHKENAFAAKIRVLELGIIDMSACSISLW